MIYLHKMLLLFFSPIFIVIILIGIGVFLKKRFLCMIATVLLLALSTPILSDQLFRFVEQHALKINMDKVPKASAVVVLSGMLIDVQLENEIVTEWVDPDRFFGGIALLKAGKASRIIFTRGKISLHKSGNTEGDYLKMLALDLGIPEMSILLTKEVRDTQDEALGVRELLDKNSRDIILVTSAFHMPRAKFLFQQEGLKVVPYPVDFKVSEKQITLIDFLPNAHTFSNSNVAVREIIGQAYYKFKTLF